MLMLPDCMSILARNTLAAVFKFTGPHGTEQCPCFHATAAITVRTVDSWAIEVTTRSHAFLLRFGRPHKPNLFRSIAQQSHTIGGK